MTDETLREVALEEMQKPLHPPTYEDLCAVLFMFGALDARSERERDVEIPCRFHQLAGYPAMADIYRKGYVWQHKQEGRDDRRTDVFHARVEAEGRG